MLHFTPFSESMACTMHCTVSFHQEEAVKEGHARVTFLIAVAFTKA